jgi:hypothetical protein
MVNVVNHGFVGWIKPWIVKFEVVAFRSNKSDVVSYADVANADAAGIFSTYTCKWKIHNGKIKIISFSVKFSS